MLKREFVLRLARQFPDFSAVTVAQMVDETFALIIREVAAGGRVEIRGFGSFFARHRKNHYSRNPGSGETIEVAAKRVPRFRAGQKLCERVNAR